jgi:hypothetical protein
MTQHVVVLLIMDMKSAKFDVHGPKKKVRFWRIFNKKKSRIRETKHSPMRIVALLPRSF